MNNPLSLAYFSKCIDCWINMRREYKDKIFDEGRLERAYNYYCSSYPIFSKHITEMHVLHRED